MKNFLGGIWKQAPVIQEDGEVISSLLIGIVAKKSDGDESWKAYVGLVGGDNSRVAIETEKKDIQTIFDHGDPLTEEEARNWFPHIDLPYRK